jgi:amino acid transporter
VEVEDSHGKSSPGLRAALTLPALTIYAIGDILGAGIYALVGKVAGICGPALWVAFLFSAVVALLTGLSYAEFASRFPRSAGAALYCHQGFRYRPLAFVVGIFVLLSGLTSAAAVSRAIVGYLNQLVAVPELAASLVFLAAASYVSFLGIEESSRVNILLTSIEVAGLVLVAVAGFSVASELSVSEMRLRLTPEPHDLREVFSAATIAFFAFVGFEDTANIAEEAKDARRAMPRAILCAIAFTTVIYVVVGIAALLAIPPETLAESPAPLAAVVDASAIRMPAWLFAVVALVAISNTGLLNLIMGARLSYGMAREGLLPSVLARVHAQRRTPGVAVLVVFGLAVLIACSGGVSLLVQTTSFLLLVVFLAVHVSLFLIKRREGAPPDDVFTVPSVVPLCGMAACLWMLFQYPADVYVRGAVALVVAVLLYVIAARFTKTAPARS